MTREELRALILRWCVVRGYQPRPQEESRSYGGVFLAERLGLRPWDVSNVVRGDWACVKEMQTPAKMATALEIDLCEVWPEEAGSLPGLHDVPDAPHVVRPCTIGIGFDIPAPCEPADKVDLLQLLARLPERELFVISKRFGLEGPEMPLEALGVMLGCTRERVRQIEVRALRRLRRRLGGPPVPASDDRLSRIAPWREGRAYRHHARSSRAGQVVELELALERVRVDRKRGRAAPARS